MLVKRSSLFFIKGLSFFFSLVSSKYLAVFNFFNNLKMVSFKNISFFIFSSSFIYFFFKDFFFFKFLNPFCFIALPLAVEDFYNFFKIFSSDFFLIGFSVDFFFFNPKFLLNLNFFGVDLFYFFTFIFKFFFYYAYLLSLVSKFYNWRKNNTKKKINYV
jgi:hypothetical protein